MEKEMNKLFDESDRIGNAVFEFIYTAALHDATLRQAYIGDTQKLKENQKMKNAIKDYIDGIFDGKSPCSVKTSNKVKEAANDINFTFGNAQKLVNMAAKYAYISTYSDRSMAEKFKNCDCPMDNVMIKAVKEKIKEKGLEQEIKKLLGKTFWRSEISNSWSNMQDENGQYENYQKIIKYLAEKEKVIPLEIDYVYWND